MPDKFTIKKNADKVFQGVLSSVTIFVLILLAGIFITLFLTSGMSFKRFGFHFLVSHAWEDRMTVVNDVTLARTDNTPFIQVQMSSPLNPESVLPGENLLLQYDTGKEIDFNWIIPESNQNLLMIYPKGTLNPGDNLRIILLSGIRDHAGFALPYNYQLNFSLTADPVLRVSDLKLLDHHSGKEIKELDGPDLKWFGALPFIIGTLLTSILALLISLPFALAIAIFLGEYYTSGPVSTFMQTTNELLAGIPSIIYGAWAFAFIVPLISRWFPQSNSGGASIFTAALILSIMIIPYSASLAREVIKLVPADIKEAAFGMGATRFSVIMKVVLPYASSGIFAGVLLSFGRALGETMAVTMVIGNRNSIPKSIFDGGQTIASLIAMEYGEAGKLKMSALSELGLILFVITLLFGIMGRFIIKRMSLRDQK